MAKKLYTVKAGESLSIIARDQLNDLSRWPEIAYVNSLSAPYTIYPGQTIFLPVDTQPLQVTVTEGAPGPADGTATTKKAAFEFTPVTFAIIGVVAVAVFMWLQDE